MIKTILPLIAIGTIMMLYFYESTEKKNKLEEIAILVNKDKSSTWKASLNIKKEYKKKDLSKMFNLIIEKEYPKSFETRPKSLKKIDLPENFDARVAWQECKSIPEVRDQSACGSCWAFGAATAMSDRLCIHSVKKNLTLDQRKISTEDLMECCDDCGYGCDGGFLYQSWEYFQEMGLVTGDLFNDKNTCKPYQFPPCNHHSHNPDREDCSKYDFSSPSCKRECSNFDYDKNYSDDLIRSTSVYGVQGEQDMMEELFTNGSIEAAFTVYEDFLTYKSGVYQHKKGSALGGHAIRVLGYGIENGVKYWLCANSWNSDWGDNGFFKILRGEDHCGIESSGVAGIFK